MQANKLVVPTLVQNTQSKRVIIMNSIMISLIVLACVVGSALMGLLLGAVLPPQHLSGHSKDMVRLGIGLIATKTAILCISRWWENLLKLHPTRFFHPESEVLD